MSLGLLGYVLHSLFLDRVSESEFEIQFVKRGPDSSEFTKASLVCAFP